MPAQVGGLTVNIRRPPGSEYRWPPASPSWPLGQYDALVGYAQDSVEQLDRFYDLNSDGVLALEESRRGTRT